MDEMAGDDGLEPALLDDDGGTIPDEVAAELAAIEEAEREAASAEARQRVQLESALTSTQQELDAERERVRAAVARYREAVLAAEPALPPELVQGETLDELEASLASARQAVARIRGQLEQERESARGFPVGAPPRGGPRTGALSAAEKIAYGLQQRPRG
jgi:multidrug resistance efflux pump